MHPNAFLRNYWRTELRDEIFVAMGFAASLRSRFVNVIKPAIEDLALDGRPIRAIRVDESRTGDSILTDIMDGIAHARLVLADVSKVCDDPDTGHPLRNGNVMYEVGIALACRMPTEVLIVRSDNDKLLFDTSVIPHVQIDFSDEQKARLTIRDHLLERLKEINYVNDARVQLALRGLSSQEIQVLKDMSGLIDGQVWLAPHNDEINLVATVAFPRLLDKGLIELLGTANAGRAAYKLRPLGRVVANLLPSLPVFQGVPVSPTVG